MNNLFLFTGEETFLLTQHLNSWKEAFKQKHGDLNYIQLDGASESVADLVSQIETAPFLGDKRLVLISNLPEAPKTKNANKVTKKDEARDEELKKLADYLAKIPESSVVVFVQANPDKRKSLYKKIVQEAEVKTFDRMNDAQLVNWVRAQSEKLGSAINPTVAEYLISLTGHSLWRLDAEVKKLSAYAESQPIDRKAIDELVVPTVEANVFQLTDALGVKDHQKAIRNLHQVMAAGENLRQTFYMVVRQFRLFLQVGGYLSNYPKTSPANIASSLKLHPFVARNTMGQLKHFSVDELKAAYERLLEIDVALKTSKIRITTEDQDELALAIERFIMKFCCCN